MVELVYIPRSNVPKVWVLAKPYIADALHFSGDHTDADFVYERLNKGTFQLWLLWDDTKNTVKEKLNGVVVSEIIQRKLKKVCHLYIVTGKNRQRWQHLIAKIEDFAKDQECDLMELIARPGWQKILNQYDYKKTHVVLEKEIKKENK